MPGLRLPLCLDANSALSHKHEGCKYTGTANMNKGYNPENVSGRPQTQSRVR